MRDQRSTLPAGKDRGSPGQIPPGALSIQFQREQKTGDLNVTNPTPPVHNPGSSADRALTARVKALLLSIGSGDVDPSLLPDELRTIATAGPGAGGTSFFITDGQHRVRLAVNTESPLKIIPWRDGVAVRKEGRIIARGRLELPLCHCPEQAYITVSERCIFDCRFCPVPLLNGRVKTINEIIALVENAAARGTVRAISLTSGVAESP